MTANIAYTKGTQIFLRAFSMYTPVGDGDIDVPPFGFAEWVAGGDNGASKPAPYASITDNTTVGQGLAPAASRLFALFIV